MSLATATTWFCNWILSITWLTLLSKFGPVGAFGWYAAWCVLGWWAVFLFMPVCSASSLLYYAVLAADLEKETKGKTLEELDQVFSLHTRDHARHAASQIPHGFKKYVMRQAVQPGDLLNDGFNGVTAGVAGEIDVV
jgi:hypothetical protein